MTLVRCKETGFVTMAICSDYTGGTPGTWTVVADHHRYWIFDNWSDMCDDFDIVSGFDSI